MISRYLQEDPAPLLLEKETPVVRYLMKRDIETGGGTIPSYKDLFDDPLVIRLFKSAKGGILGSGCRFDLYYRGAQWRLAEAVEYGLDGRTEVVKNTAELVASETTGPDGGFTFNWKPPLSAACRTGDMVYYLSAVLGRDNDVVRRGVDWICARQRHDGGWLHCPLGGTCDMMKLTLFRRAGSGLKREKDQGVSSCFYASASCLKGLIAAGPENSDVIQKGVDFFLGRRLFLGRGSEPIIPGNSWNRDFRLLGYPVLCQYDLLTGLDLVSQWGCGDDERISPAFNLLMQKQNSNGTWNLEQTGTGMLYGPADASMKGAYNAMVTLRVLRFLKNFKEG